MNTFIKIIVICTLLFISLLSCQTKSVKLPTLGVKGIEDTIYNNSKIWLFYKTVGNDTLAEMNKNNKVANTHWIFNIDRRLSLKHIIPSIKKLQEKKATPSIHDNGEITHTYFSYVDTLSKALSFIVFDSVHYVSAQDNAFNNSNFNHFIIRKTKNHLFINDSVIGIRQIEPYLKSKADSTRIKVHLAFDKNVSYQDYLYIKAILENIKNDFIRIDNREVVVLE